MLTRLALGIFLGSYMLGMKKARIRNADEEEQTEDTTDDDNREIAVKQARL